MIYEHYDEYPVDKWRWKNFTPKEMSCRGDQNLMVDEDAMDKLQALRGKIGKPFHILSAYRSPSYNKKIGGATRSQHMVAKAFDVSMANHDRKEFEVEARKAGFTGFGFYPSMNFMHIDTGPAREWGTRW